MYVQVWIRVRVRALYVWLYLMFNVFISFSYSIVCLYKWYTYQYHDDMSHMFWDFYFNYNEGRFKCKEYVCAYVYLNACASILKTISYKSHKSNKYLKYIFNCHQISLSIIFFYFIHSLFPPYITWLTTSINHILLPKIFQCSFHFIILQWVWMLVCL